MREVILFTFTTKLGKDASIRYPLIEDAPALLEMINEVSKEDTFIRFSGEQLSLEEETEYLESEIRAIEMGECVKLFCFVENQLAGTCDVRKDRSLLDRKKHVGLLGIVVGSAFRGEGVGQRLMEATIAEAKKELSGLRMIKLECFSTNTVAMSLYNKLGFRETGRTPGGVLHKGQYIDAVEMSIPLQ